MKLLMLKAASLPGLDLPAGKECEVPEPAATNLLKAGCARAVADRPGRDRRPGTPIEVEGRLRRLREACVECGLPEPVIGDILRTASLLAPKALPAVEPAAPVKPEDPPPPPAGEVDSKPSEDPPTEPGPPAPSPRKPNPRRPGG